MKHQKYISAFLASSMLLSSGVSNAYAIDMTSWLGNLINTSISDSMEGLGNSGWNSSDEEGQSNSDYSVKDHEVKKGNFSVSNGALSVDGVYYVYGNLTVSNSDLTVKGKLKVTGDLTVSNGDIINNGRIYVLGKKRVSNGNTIGTPTKISVDLAKYDSILRADLDKEEEAKIVELIATMKKNVESLKKDLKIALERNERLETIKEKIRNEKEIFFKEMGQYIQEEDTNAFGKIQKADTDATEKFLSTFKRLGAPSETLRKQIETIVSKFPADKKVETLNRLVTKLDALLANNKLSLKKKNLIAGVKEVLEDELDKISTDDELSNLVNDTAVSGSGNITTSSTTSESGAITTSGTTVTQ